MGSVEWTVIATGLVIVGLILVTTGRLTDRVNTLSERIARMEGKTDLLLQGLQIRVEPPA